MDDPGKKKLNIAKSLVDSFLQRTGIVGVGGDVFQRYLWTDAFAVHACFALSHLFEDKSYHQYAIHLIDKVHNILGKHRRDDHRSGWISGLPEEEGKRNPTINGLRIGKKYPDSTFSGEKETALEWQSDGQYFHYLTRWFNALLQAFRETGSDKYGLMAAALIKAGEKFVKNEGENTRMVWKMNVDLSKTTVEGMGAHDPLDGLVCVVSAAEAFTDCKIHLGVLEQKLKEVCKNQEWYTTDSLGIGGLLLNLGRASELAIKGKTIPACINPQKLLEESISSLQTFNDYGYNLLQPADERLAFRECGLSLGLRVVCGNAHRYQDLGIDFKRLESFVPLARQIETFWLQQENQQGTSWVDHLDINSVTLACSLLASEYPIAFNSIDYQTADG